jgi:hydrogenase nickel incorporation protein HypA/HybF
MHEMSIALGLVEAVRTEMGRHGSKRLLRVGISIGELAGVDRQSLSFCLDATFAEEHWGQVVTEFRAQAVEARCRTCTRCFQPPRDDFRCPDCQTAAVDVLRGDAVEIEWLEVE